MYITSRANKMLQKFAKVCKNFCKLLALTYCCSRWNARNAYLFSPLGKLAERAIYFTFRSFYLFSKIFFNDFSETNYLKICWTDFLNLYIEWKLFGCRWSIWTPFFDISRDIAMATDFVQKWGKIAYHLCTYRSVIQNWYGITPCMCKIK